MLNNFCFHVYTQKSLIRVENCNGVFFDDVISSTLTCEFRVHRADSQLKNVRTSDKSWEPGMLLKTWKTWKTFEKMEKSLTLSHSHSLTLDMLDNFCFHVYSQKMVYSRKLQCFFWDIVM